MKKTAFRMKSSKHHLNPWILENLPENHLEMDYLEPYCGAASVFFAKDRARFEVLNDSDVGMMQIYRALRDEPKAFIAKVRRTRCTERVFEREQKLQGAVFEDYLEQAFNEYFLRKTSRNGTKRVFSCTDPESLESAADELVYFAERIANTVLLSKSALEVINAFDADSTFCYCDPPGIEAEFEDDEQMPADDHISLAERLVRFQGKVMVTAVPTMLYRRLYKEWRCIKRKGITDKKAECIWVNW